MQRPPAVGLRDDHRQVRQVVASCERKPKTRGCFPISALYDLRRICRRHTAMLSDCDATDAQRGVKLERGLDQERLDGLAEALAQRLGAVHAVVVRRRHESGQRGREGHGPRCSKPHGGPSRKEQDVR